MRNLRRSLFPRSRDRALCWLYADSYQFRRGQRRLKYHHDYLHQSVCVGYQRHRSGHMQRANLSGNPRDQPSYSWRDLHIHGKLDILRGYDNGDYYRPGTGGRLPILRCQR